MVLFAGGRPDDPHPTAFLALVRACDRVFSFATSMAATLSKTVVAQPCRPTGSAGGATEPRRALEPGPIPARNVGAAACA